MQIILMMQSKHVVLAPKELDCAAQSICFFEADRIKAMREMIVATTTQERKEALEKLLPYQQKDFEGIYQAMEGAPVVIRFLDPPLHEFLPTKRRRYPSNC